MAHRQFNMGKAIAGAMLTLLMVVGLVPTAAIAEQPAGEEMVLTTQASKSVVRGKGWKLALPKYWRKNAKTSTSTYNGKKTIDITSRKGEGLLYLVEMDAQSMKQYTNNGRNASSTKVRLKNGKKAALYPLPMGGVGFFVKTGRGRYLMVDTFDYRIVEMSSKATRKRMAKLQSFGKTSRYTSKTAYNCLKTIAKKLSC